MNNQKVTREFVMEEVGFWVNGDNMNDKKMNDLDGDWLEHSSQNEKCRVVQINGNEIYGVCLEAGAAIQVSSKPEFSAHNLKIKIEQNKIYKCKGEGIRIQDLAINNLQILRNEVFIMGSHCMTIKQVHQKSNKSKFLMQEN